MRFPRTFTSFSLVSLVLFGFGCKPPESLPDVGVRPRSAFGQANSPAPSAAATVPRPKPKSKADRDAAVTELLRALGNLGTTQSFRSQMIAETPNGSMSGDMAYVKDQGFHGKLRLPGPVETEVLVRDTGVWFKTGTSSFQNVTDTPQGLELGQLARSQFDVTQATSSIFSADTDLIDISNDRGCLLYVFERNVNEVTETNQFCLRDNVPIYISSATPDRRIEFRYRDFNAPITLPKP